MRFLLLFLGVLLSLSLSAGVELCDVSACGSLPGMGRLSCGPNSPSQAGFTGRCLKDRRGICGWEVAFCPVHEHPCLPNPCSSGEVCVPEPKVCITAPCYQYRCDPAPCDCANMSHIQISFPCWDGSWVGYTECGRNHFGECEWQLAECPPSTLTCATVLCIQNTTCQMVNGQPQCLPNPAGEEICDCSGMAAIQIALLCEDGSTVGYTDCRRGDDGQCGWHLAECPAPPATDCAAVSCLTGWECQVINGNAQCVETACDCSDMAAILIAFQCSDGSWVGYTDCRRDDNGQCGLHLAQCPGACAAVTCMAGWQCEEVNGEAQCVPNSDLCDPNPCPSGLVCQPAAVSCLCIEGMVCNCPQYLCVEPEGDCTQDECGPMLLIAKVCSDGTTLGMTECNRNENGQCERSFPECPDSDCDLADCGPPLGMPNELCDDGINSSGPSGRCIQVSDGVCGWEILSCPEDDPCASDPCPTGQMCVPEIKQCFTTPCPQYRCECTDCGIPIDVLFLCPDGTITHAGTECGFQENGTCGWTIIPPPCFAPLEVNCSNSLMLCAECTTCQMVDGQPQCMPDPCCPNPCPTGQSCHPADFACQCVDCDCQSYTCDASCTEEECGARTLQALLCPDGSELGMTVCGRNSDGECGWSFPPCPAPPTCSEPAQQGSPCDLARCAAGTICVSINGNAQCIGQQVNDKEKGNDKDKHWGHFDAAHPSDKDGEH